MRLPYSQWHSPAGKLPWRTNGFGELVDHDAAKITAVTVAASVEYGEYLGQDCIGCHGAGYSGGAIPGAPPDWPEATNISPDKETGIGSWTQENFSIAIRTGVRPDGSEINPLMPWQNLSQMTDVELEARQKPLT